MGKKKEEKDEIVSKKSRKPLIIGISTFCVIALVIIVYLFIFIPQIDLKGKKHIILNYQDSYKEKGFKASFLGNDVTKDVKVKGKVNSKKLGTYKITYRVKVGSFENTVTRVVEVKDTEKPVIDTTVDDIYVCPGCEVVPEELKATDNYDGDLSKSITHSLNKEKDTITYMVKDTSGNVSEISKKILYQDVEKPTITLNGNEVMYAFLGEGFQDPGATATDNCDKDIQNKIKVNGFVNTNELGEYTLTYEAEDSSSNKASINRKVIVRRRGGVIYLTFDDGPKDGTTNVILDILKEEGVKATFFVTGYGPDELIKREFDEGHTVALHTNVHDYATVYASDEAYFNDLNAIGARVKNITGQESKIIRFPGGSSNTVSRHYSQGIMSRLTQEVLNRGYRYYDWNVSSGDAGNTTEAYGVYSNVVNGLRTDRDNIVLMHDVKTYTRDALRDIIRYGKENGYYFDRITMDTDMVRQRVNN